jgi:predicted nucleic acid-binding protein
VSEIVYDSGALIALEGRKAAAALTRHRRHLELGDSILVPAVDVAQVVRNPARQIPLLRVLSGCQLIPFEPKHCVPVGRLLAAAGTSDVVDAFVALIAAETDAAVVTSDTGDIGRLLKTLGAPGPVLAA